MAIGRINASLSGVQPGGLAKIVPTSVAVGSGSGSVDSNGNVTFSGASSISVNGCFNSSYENYRLLISSGSNSNNTNVNFRFRVSGTDNTSANYYIQRSMVNQSGTASASSDNGATAFTLSTNTTGGTMIAHSLDILQPFKVDRKFLFGTGFDVVSASYGTRFYGAQFNDTISFDGFTLINSSGLFSGTLRVYGYNN